jgi:hypothetical protein
LRRAVVRSRPDDDMRRQGTEFGCTVDDFLSGVFARMLGCARSCVGEKLHGSKVDICVARGTRLRVSSSAMVCRKVLG